MPAKGLAIFSLCIILAISAQGIEYKKEARLTHINDWEIEQYLVAPGFTAAEFCTVNHADSAAWGVIHWLIGNELYKAYQDPALTCSGPYPFTVEKIYIVLAFDMACSLYISIDVESADMTDPECPFPGELLSISSTYQVNIPGAGMYQIETPLDSPAVVNEPYFIGFFFASYVDTLWGTQIITDDNPVSCVNYNIWDTAIGYVDLTDTGYPSFPSFPGRMLLFSAGTPGGGGGEQPEPSITIIKPEADENISGEAVIWAAETSGSNIIDSVQFHYRGPGPWYFLATDPEGSSPLRNGVDFSGTGDGWSIGWDYTALTEGTYWIKGTVFDTLGHFDIDSVNVSVDPTPPEPTFVNPVALSLFCLPQTLEITTSDEDVATVNFEKKAASYDYQIPVITLNQFNYGDNNGNPGDGNSALSGEYGDYYCGPVAGAIAVKYWFDQGYILSMREGTQYISVDTVVERLAENMLTRANYGTYDDLFYSGMLQYIATHGNELRLNAYRNPDYHLFRTLLQEREQVVIMGLSGTPGLYLVAAGVTGLADEQDRFAVQVSDPLTGIITDAFLRNTPTGSEVFYDGSWHDMDMIITVVGNNHLITRDFIGEGSISDDAWTFLWESDELLEDSLYFISATATDLSGRADMATSMIIYDCTPNFTKGDFNDDGIVNIGDALYLSEFIFEDGPEPVGGAGRADSNCDSNIDISDVIFIIKYIFDGGIEPCY